MGAGDQQVELQDLRLAEAPEASIAVAPPGASSHLHQGRGRLSAPAALAVGSLLLLCGVAGTLSWQFSAPTARLRDASRDAALLPSAAALEGGTGSDKGKGEDSGVGSPRPLLGDGSAVDYWFAFKLPTAKFEKCSDGVKCIFGGEAQDYHDGWGLQYLLASSRLGSTQDLEFHSECLGSGGDPVAKTFGQVWDGHAPNYVIWNDQFDKSPIPKAGHPWGHSKGVLAWDTTGSGFIMQVSTPDWPGNGDSAKDRDVGNTLGCIDHHNNVKVAQHFFALRLPHADDTQKVLEGLRRANVVTKTSVEELFKLTDGPENLAELAKSLGHVDSSTTPLAETLSVSTSGSKGVRLIAKPSKLEVPPWHLVSALTGEGLRVATWYHFPVINSTHDGETPGCWAEGLGTPREVQSALSGSWDGKSIGFLGQPSPHGNHAKLAHSLGGSLTVLGDMNQQGSYSPEDNSVGCVSSQNGRGGLFFAVDDQKLHDALEGLMKGATADYRGEKKEDPAGACGGEGVTWSSCRKISEDEACAYVQAEDASECSLPDFGCYKASVAIDCSGDEVEEDPAGSCGGAGVNWSACRKISEDEECGYVKDEDAPECGLPDFGCYKASVASACNGAHVVVG